MYECMKIVNEKFRVRYCKEDMYVMFYKISCIDWFCRKDILYGCIGEICGKGSNFLRVECGL